MRLERRQLPDLAIAGEWIRRRSQRHIEGELFRICPDLSAIGRRAQGEIAIDAERKTGIARPCGGGRKLTVSDPLEPDPEFDRLGIGRCKCSDRAVGGGAPFGRPPTEVDSADVVGQCLVDRVLPQLIACGRHSIREFLPELGACRRSTATLEVRERGRERGALYGPDTGVVDIGEVAKPAQGVVRIRQYGAQARRVDESIETGKVDVDRIDETAVGRLIGAGPLAIRREQVMQRIDAGDGTTEPRGGLAELGQRLEIADSGILIVAQGIEVRCQSKQLCAVRRWLRSGSRSAGSR